MEFAYINGLKIYAATSKSELIDYAASHNSILVAVNAEKIVNVDSQLRRIVNSNVGYADGIGAILVLRQKKFFEPIRIPGCELWLDIVEKFVDEKSFYFIGGEEHVIEATISKLRLDFDGIEIAGYRNGYINSAEEKRELFDRILQSKPDVVFVAMGSPKQEILMEELREIHPALYQGLGGSFDVYVNKVRRAPPIFITLNLEWLYRVIKQPSRFFRQMALIRFIWLLLSRKF